MNEKEIKLIEAIDQYLSGSLEGEELKDFEQRLQEDADLRTEVELHQLSDQVMSNLPKLELRSKLKQLRQKHDNSHLDQTQGKAKVRSLYNLKNLLSIAAAILVLVVFVFVIRNQFSDPAYSKYAQLEAQLGDTDDTDGMTFLTSPGFSKKTYKVSEGGEVTFELKGQLKTIELSTQDQFTLKIYNNKNELISPSANTPSDMAIAFQGPLEGEGELAFGKTRTYPFQSQQKLDLKPGLYYYIITLDNEENGLYVGKFKVK